MKGIGPGMKDVRGEDAKLFVGATGDGLHEQ